MKTSFEDTFADNQPSFTEVE